MQSGLVFNIQKYSLQDGPGIRTTVFLKGCPLDCWWCHNPESQERDRQIVLMESRCVRCGMCRAACPADLAGVCRKCGECVEACPTGARQWIGREMTSAQVMAEILKDRVFYDDSEGGATFSGGEPLGQVDFLCEMLEMCRAEGVRTALDTCGYAKREQVLRAAALCDLVLYDLKVMDDERHIRYTGVSNALIVDNLRALGEVHGNIWIRVPVVPGLNDDEENLDATAKLAASIGGVKRVSLLPYHSTGSAKFERLGRECRTDGIATPTEERLGEIAERFRRLGLDARSGG